MNFWVPRMEADGGQGELHPDHLWENVVGGTTLLEALTTDLKGLSNDATTLMWRLHGNALLKLVRTALELLPPDMLTSEEMERVGERLNRVQSLAEGTPTPPQWGESTSLPDWWFWTTPDIHATYRQKLLAVNFAYYQPRWLDIRLKPPGKQPAGIVIWPPLIVRETLRNAKPHARFVRCGELLFAGTSEEIVTGIFNRAFGQTWREWLARVGYPSDASATKPEVFRWMLERGIIVDNTYLGW